MHIMKIHNRIDSRYMYTHARNLGCTSLEQNSHRRACYMKAVKICRASYFSRVDETFLSSRPLLFALPTNKSFIFKSSCCKECDTRIVSSPRSLLLQIRLGNTTKHNNLRRPYSLTCQPRFDARVCFLCCLLFILNHY